MRDIACGTPVWEDIRDFPARGYRHDRRAGKRPVARNLRERAGPTPASRARLVNDPGWNSEWHAVAVRFD
jgi:hypothetical protein